MQKKIPFFRDVWNAILNDEWMWVVAWGKPRTGKTTIQLKIAYEIYQDWELVLQSFAFNLNDIMYKIKTGSPCKLPTLNGLHSRVPILIADDFGAQCNKAKTQHEPAWDIFKGAFDTLGTKIGVLFASMGMPSGATQQIQEKYTHEIYVDKRGHAKYDKVDWQQNYGGWQAMQNKIWLHEFTFDPVPVEIYKKYDIMRQSLVDELLLQIDDAQIENEGPKTFRRLTREDIEFIELINRKGQVSNDWLNNEGLKWKETAFKCKTRGIITHVKHGTAYWYDLTDFGCNMLKLIETKRAEGVTIPTEPLKTLTP